MNAEAVAAALHHLLEITGPIEHRSAASLRLQNPDSLATAPTRAWGWGPPGQHRQLLGQPPALCAFQPSFQQVRCDTLQADGLNPVAAVGTPQIGGQTIGSKLAEVDLGDADGWSIAVVTDLVHLVTDLARPRKVMVSLLAFAEKG